MRQLLRAHRIIRHHHHHHHAHNHRHAPHHKKHDLPGTEPLRDIKLEAITHQRAHDPRRPNPNIPQPDPRRLLVAPVPHGGDEDQAGADGGFEGAEQEAGRDEGAVGVAGARAGYHRAPADDHCAQVFGGGEALHEVGVGEFEGQEGDVEEEGEGAEFFAVEVRVF